MSKATEKRDRRDLVAATRPQLLAAFERVRPQLAELPDSELLWMNLDPMAIASTVYNAVPALLEMRPDIERCANSFELEHLDNLETYALALMQTQSLWQGTEKLSRTLATLAAAAEELRETLVADTIVLVRRGHIALPRLSGLRGSNGHRNVASDILTLAALLRDSWPIISSKTAITEEELNHAEALGEQLIRALGRRDRYTAAAIALSKQRHQIYTLLVVAYNEVRRVVAFLRPREGDAEKLAPSLYGKRKRLKKKAAPEGALSDANAAASLEATSNGSKNSSNNAPTAAPTEAEKPEAAKPPMGWPGSDPFTDAAGNGIASAASSAPDPFTPDKQQSPNHKRPINKLANKRARRRK